MIENWVERDTHMFTVVKTVIESLETGKTLLLSDRLEFINRNEKYYVRNQITNNSRNIQEKFKRKCK